MNRLPGAFAMQLISPSIEHDSVRSLRPYPRNARRHNKGQIKQIAASITRFGFNNPILIADDGEIVAGHGRLAAATPISGQFQSWLACLKGAISGSAAHS